MLIVVSRSEPLDELNVNLPTRKIRYLPITFFVDEVTRRTDRLSVVTIKRWYLQDPKPKYMFGKRYKKPVLEILDRAKNYAPAIGKYCDHSIDRDAQIVVRLSNGTLSMPVEAAVKQDSLPHSLHEDWIETIARTFERGQRGPGSIL